jgi:DNA-directed RNA polymerase specialized sigma24 family protein
VREDRVGRSQPEQTQTRQQDGWFATTHWSVVLAAGQADAQRRAAALETLCRTYWEPLYGYPRFLGHSVHDAEDLTQAFLLHLLAGDAFAAVKPERGKFRSFLLKSLRNFVADERDRALAARRAGGQQAVSLDAELAERHYRDTAADAGSAEALFDRRWAMGVINRAFARLQEEFMAEGKSAQMVELGSFLAGDGDAAQYQAAGQRLNLLPAAVAVAVHRLRQRYRDCIRAEIAQTVTTSAEVEEEMHYLLEVLTQ